MTDQASDGGLFIDSDWKAEAAREKERLAAQEAVEKKPRPGDPSAPSINDQLFLELINLLATQAVVSLSGLRGPGGENIPPSPATAKHFIDMLGAMNEKTKGNLTDDETKLLDSVLYELRMQFVQMTGRSATPSDPSKEQKPS